MKTNYLHGCESYQHIDKILMAISGGQDSMGLLHFFFNLIKTRNIKLVVVHFDHKWRFDAEINELLIGYLSIYLNCDYYCLSSTLHTKDELSSRLWRYQEINNLAQLLEIEYVSTGHSMTDRVETMLYNLIRGTGLNGITSNNELLYLNKQLKLIRPFINLTRHDLYWYNRKILIPTWTDYTNYDYTKSRNKIRYELMPYLKNQFNPQIDCEINRFVQNLSYEFDYIQSKASFFYKLALHPHKQSLYRKLLINLHPALQLRILQIFLRLALGKSEVNISWNNIVSSKTKLLKIDNQSFLYNGKNWIHIIKIKKKAHRYTS